MSARGFSAFFFDVISMHRCGASMCFVYWFFLSAPQPMARRWLVGIRSFCLGVCRATPPTGRPTAGTTACHTTNLGSFFPKDLFPAFFPDFCVREKEAGGWGAQKSDARKRVVSVTRPRNPKAFCLSARGHDTSRLRQTNGVFFLCVV